MTLRDRILARADLSAMRAARDITGLAAALNEAPDSDAQSRFVTARTVLAECADGAAILDALSAVSGRIGAVKWALTFLSQDSGLDIGNAVTRGMIDQLVTAAALTTAQGAALKSLGEVPEIVTQEQVAEEMYSPDGSEK